jgi:hypothetical protein
MVSVTGLVVQGKRPLEPSIRAQNEIQPTLIDTILRGYRIFRRLFAALDLNYAARNADRRLRTEETHG